jgi:hypothetical protein
MIIKSTPASHPAGGGKRADVYVSTLALTLDLVKAQRVLTNVRIK